MSRPTEPRRFRWSLVPGALHPNGTEATHRHGCYFPLTDLVVTDMGHRRTGAPYPRSFLDFEWLDEPPGAPPVAGPILRDPPTMSEMLGQPGEGEDDTP